MRKLFEILNIGNSSPKTLNELLSIFEKVTGIKAKTKNRVSNNASAESTFADITKAKAMLGWEPKTSIEDGITKLVTWFRNNRLKNIV